MRNEHTIKEIVRKIKHQASKQLSLLSPGSPSLSSCYSPLTPLSRLTLSSPRAKTRRLAKAQQVALQNAKQRLIHQKSLVFLEDND